MRYGFPIVLDLEGKTCVVVGNGPHAEEKAAELRAAGAAVRRITRPFRASDLDGAALAVVETGDADENRRVFLEAQRRGIPVNSIDDPENCSFYFPAVLRRGDLVIALSTSGKCPALGVRLKQWLDGKIGPEYGEFVRIAGELREEIRESVPGFSERKELWYELVDSPALDLLRAGKQEEAERLLRDRVAERSVERWVVF
jgi:siroheme synthase-like protein